MALLKPGWLRGNTILVFDTGPLLAVATGLPFKTLSAASFVLHDYEKARSRSTIGELRGDFLEQLERKEQVEDRVLGLIEYCIVNPGNCVVPAEVLGELSRYGFQQEIRDLWRMLLGGNERVVMVAEYNRNMRMIGRGEDSRNPQTIKPELYEALVGRGFDWKRVNLNDALADPVTRKWYNAMRALARARRDLKGLSRTDILILAYTASLNEKGIPAMAVFGDRKMKKLAAYYRIPYYYIYEDKPRNVETLGNLQAPLYGRPLTENQSLEKRKYMGYGPIRW